MIGSTFRYKAAAVQIDLDPAHTVARYPVDVALVGDAG
jgi:thiamine pyrophosphate-dependent acetolactate synthase large subunit-like protein